MVISAEDYIPDGEECCKVPVKMLSQPAVMDAMHLRPIKQPAEPTQAEFKVGMNEKRPSREDKTNRVRSESTCAFFTEFDKREEHAHEHAADYAQ